ncbi:hypothetical protein EJ02DRAFT_362280, partial [Clathrospora elynae]
ELEGLRGALTTKKKHKKKSKALDLQQRQEYYGGAVFWSPRKMREAYARETVRQRDEAEEKLQKAKTKELREAAKLLKKREAEGWRVERERLKEEREKKKATKAAQYARQKEERDSVKALQLPKKGKRQASRPPTTSNKRQKLVGGQPGHAQVQDEPLGLPHKVTSCGRNIKLPSKFR